jgi:hypothetical protein
VPTDIKLEQYLATLDRALGPVPVSDRAEIVTEIKSHVLDAQARDPNKDLGAILSSLGEPETVANRYLLERGLKPGKAPKSPIVKWLTIGFLGTFAISALFVIVIISSFTPLIKVDEEAGKVTILGGLIDIDEKKGKVRVGGTQIQEIEDGDSKIFQGSSPVSKASFDRIDIPFSNAKLEISPSEDKEIHWLCKIHGPKSSNPKDGASVTTSNRVLTLNLQKTLGAKCNIEVPDGIAMNIEGSNGSLEVDSPRANLTVKIDNGKVTLSPDGELNYRFDNKVINGSVDDFESSTAKDALSIQVSVVNGSIEKD